MMTPLPRIYQVYSLLSQEEKRRETHAATQFLPESASLHAGVQRNMRFPPQLNQNLRRPDGKKPVFFCKFCNRNGHTEDRCWKKHGLPPNYGDYKGKKVAAGVQGDYDSTNSMTEIA